MKLYVEGGGDAKTLRTACRNGFSEFFRKAGFSGRMPRIVACGGRQNAYDSFCTAVGCGQEAMLLVDSESPVKAVYRHESAVQWKPWEHLRNRPGDRWNVPAGATDEDCHLMVQCMEAWFLADVATLQNFYGQGFNANALPAQGNRIESITKGWIYSSLANATRSCKTKAIYGKGEHSFKLLALISPALVMTASPWAKRLIDVLQARA